MYKRVGRFVVCVGSFVEKAGLSGRDGAFVENAGLSDRDGCFVENAGLFVVTSRAVGVIVGAFGVNAGLLVGAVGGVVGCRVSSNTGAAVSDVAGILVLSFGVGDPVVLVTGALVGASVVDIAGCSVSVCGVPMVGASVIVLTSSVGNDENCAAGAFVGGETDDVGANVTPEAVGVAVVSGTGGAEGSLVGEISDVGSNVTSKTVGAAVISGTGAAEGLLVGEEVG